MGEWFQEDVAGDRYIYDRELNPVVLGIPQGVPVFVIPGEHEEEAARACRAHNETVGKLQDVRMQVGCARGQRTTQFCGPLEAEKLRVFDLERRLAKVLEMIKPARVKWAKKEMESPEYHAWCLLVPLFEQARAIAEGLDETAQAGMSVSRGEDG